MNIKFTGRYKSIKEFEWNNIPKLAIITGLNGAGKSQLLELIEEYIYQPYRSQNVFPKPDLIPLFITEVFDASEVTYLKGEWSLNESTDVDLAKIQANSSNLLQAIVQNNLENYKHSDFKLFKRLTDIRDYFNAKGVKPADITPNAFRDGMERSTISDDKGIVQKVSEFFYNYRLNFLDLKIKENSDEVIRERIGEEPWQILRDIIQEAQLPFEITDPSTMGIKDSYKFTITKTTSGETVKFDDLSSGERVLFSLAFLMFNSQEAKRYPRLLLLDEPDAHLHPVMTSQLLNVLKNVLVDKYGVRVIMTTHSPSTVAISPEKSILYLDPAVGYPIHIDKDAAIKTLLAGIPNLYVNYSNRRQVFVESDNDVSFYDQIYKRLFSLLDPNVNLYFISSGDSATDKNGQPKSNCDQVIKIATILREAGNQHVYGIIDFDEGKNNQTDNIIVLGLGNRYSIENYIFDPVLVGMLLLREKYITANDTGVHELLYNDVNTHNKENLQKLADYVTAKVKSQTKITDEDKKTCEILNGIQLEIPTWYLMHQGHELETLLIRAFPKLNDIKKNKEEKLKLAIIEKVIDDFPKLIAKDILDTFHMIQK